MKWMGADNGWDSAIEAVRKCIEEIVSMKIAPSSTCGFSTQLTRQAESILATSKADTGDAGIPVSEIRNSALEEAAKQCDLHAMFGWNDDRVMQAKLCSHAIRTLKTATPSTIKEEPIDEVDLEIQFFKADCQAANQIIADYKEHYDFPAQGESHMHDCITDYLGKTYFHKREAEPSAIKAEPTGEQL